VAADEEEPRGIVADLVGEERGDGGRFEAGLVRLKTSAETPAKK
jgi:hypothetical protein